MPLASKLRACKTKVPSHTPLVVLPVEGIEHSSVLQPFESILFSFGSLTGTGQFCLGCPAPSFFPATADPRALGGGRQTATTTVTTTATNHNAWRCPNFPPQQLHNVQQGSGTHLNLMISSRFHSHQAGQCLQECEPSAVLQAAVHFTTLDCVAGEVTPLLFVDLRYVMFVAQPHSRPGQAPVLRASAASCRPVCVHEGGGCA